MEWDGSRTSYWVRRGVEGHRLPPLLQGARRPGEQAHTGRSTSPFRIGKQVRRGDEGPGVRGRIVRILQSPYGSMYKYVNAMDGRAGFRTEKGSLSSSVLGTCLVARRPLRARRGDNSQLSWGWLLISSDDFTASCLSSIRQSHAVPMRQTKASTEHQLNTSNETFVGAWL